MANDLIAPGRSVGVVGGGQLARMMVQAAISLDLPLTVLAAHPDDAAASIWRDVLIGPPDSLEALERLAERSSMLTFDHELVDVRQLSELERRGVCLRPGAFTMAIARDKLRQRETFAALGLPVPAFRRAETVQDVRRFAHEHGWPVVVKARRGGYDGRAVAMVSDGRQAEAALALYHESIPVLVERHVALERELAVLVARRPAGEARAYPLVETVQRNGMCHEVIAPAPVSPELAARAIELGLEVARAVDVAGILAVELFVSVAGDLLINEIAARPHNSGHFTIDGAATSQFENHLRAILDLPLGSTELLSPAAVMVNLVASSDALRTDRLADALSVGDTRIHLYGKQPRPGRKIGHVTALGQDVDEVRRRAWETANRLAGELAGAGA